MSAAVTEVVIAFGSNLDHPLFGRRLVLIQGALAGLAAAGIDVQARSRIYATEPVGQADQPFLNGAIRGRTALAPLAILRACLAVERALGRQRLLPGGNRTIDLDLLLARRDDATAAIINTAELTLPHPRMLDRDFVLVPAAEVAPQWLHPATGRSLQAEAFSRGYGRLTVGCEGEAAWPGSR